MHVFMDSSERTLYRLFGSSIIMMFLWMPGECVLDSGYLRKHINIPEEDFPEYNPSY